MMPLNKKNILFLEKFFITGTSQIPTQEIKKMVNLKIEKQSWFLMLNEL
jgi:hypothetical protein